MQQRHPGQLGNLQLHIEEADLGRGNFLSPSGWPACLSGGGRGSLRPAEGAAAGLPGSRAVTLPCDKAAAPAAVLFGLEGPSLTEWEKGFFREVQPAGFIIFRRNVESPAQLAELTMCLRDVLGRGDAPIDRSGRGRVRA